MSTTPEQQPPSQPLAPPQEKTSNLQPNGVNVRREIEQIRRIVNGANKRLDRLCDEIASK